MGPIDGDPSADDDQAITDTKNDLGHGLLALPRSTPAASGAGALSGPMGSNSFLRGFCPKSKQFKGEIAMPERLVKKGEKKQEG